MLIRDGSLFLCALLPDCAAGDIISMVENPIIDLDATGGVFLAPHQFADVIGPDRATMFEG
jgi:hypothetical protein